KGCTSWVIILPIPAAEVSHKVSLNKEVGQYVVGKACLGNNPVFGVTVSHSVPCKIRISGLIYVLPLCFLSCFRIISRGQIPDIHGIGKYVNPPCRIGSYIPNSWSVFSFFIIILNLCVKAEFVTKKGFKIDIGGLSVIARTLYD